MTGQTFTLDDAAFRAVLDRLSAACADLSVPMDKIGFALSQRAQLSFVDQHDPWGGAWAPLAPATLAKRRDEGRQGATILRDTSQLMQSLMHAPEGDGVDIRIGNTNRPATIHQFGGQAGRGGRTNIPARPMLPIKAGGEVQLPPDWLDELIEITRGHLDGAAS